MPSIISLTKSSGLLMIFFTLFLLLVQGLVSGAVIAAR
jgi:hypothetical protein